MSTSNAIRTGMYGAMQLVGQASITGSAATTLTVSGLNLTTDSEYFITINFKNATGSQSVLSMFYNSDTTATNYDRQAHGFSNVTDTGGRANDAFCCLAEASSTTIMFYRLTNDVDGKPTAFGSGREGVTTGITTRYNTHMWRTAANVTSITLSASVASSLAVGTSIKVYKIGAPTQSSGSILKRTRTTVTGEATVAAALIPYDNTAPLSSEGVEFTGFSTSFAATDSTSIINASLRLGAMSNSVNGTIYFAIWKDGTTFVGGGVVSPGGTNFYDQVVVDVDFVAGNTSAHTYTVRAGSSSSSTVRINTDGTSNYGNTISSSLTLTEHKA